MAVSGSAAAFFFNYFFLTFFHPPPSSPPTPPLKKINKKTQRSLKLKVPRAGVRLKGRAGAGAQPAGS